MTKLRAAVMAALLVTVLAPTVAAATPTPAALRLSASWPQSRLDLANTGFNQNEYQIDGGNASRLQQAWVRADGESANAAPAVVDNIIYIGCGAAMCAIQAPTQVLKWKSPVPSGSITYSAAAVGPSLVYAGTSSSANGTVYAFDRQSGAIRWSFSTSGPNVWAGPSLANGVLYVGGDDQNLYALDAGTGARLWSFHAGARIMKTPAVVNGTVYLGAGLLYALSAADGRLLWSGLRGADPVSTSPVVAGGRLFVGTDPPSPTAPSNFYAFSAAGCGSAHCEPVWAAAIGMPPSGSTTEARGVQSSAAVADGTVYVGGPDGKIYALDPSSGSVRWTGITHGSQTTIPQPHYPTPIPASPAVANGVVYISSWDGFVYAYSASGCATLTCNWLFAASLDGGDGTGYQSNCWDTTTSSPVVVNGFVYVGGCIGSTTDALYAFAVLPCPPKSPPTGGQYHPLDAPQRMLDTRRNGGPIGAGETRQLPITGHAAIPGSGVAAVILNVTVTDATAASYLTVYPSGPARPVASNLNWRVGQTVANLVEVGLGPDGAVTLFNAAGSVDVVVDAQGWVEVASAIASSGLDFIPQSPYRVLDTRDGTGAPAGRLGPGAGVTVRVNGGGFSSAAVLNLTVTNATAASYLTVWQAAAPRPASSNINFAPGQTIANRVIVPDGSGGIYIYNAAGYVDVIADLNGAYRIESVNRSSGCGMTPVAPTRILDTRGTSQPLGPNGSASVQVTGGVIPVTAKAAVATLTVTDTTAASYLTAWPADAPQPLASDLNWMPGQTVPNLVVVGLSAAGTFELYNAAGSADLIVDVVGWYQ